MSRIQKSHGTGWRTAGAFITSVVILLGVAWAFGALWFDFPLAALRKGLAVGFVVLVGVMASGLRPRWRARLAAAVAVLIVMTGWLTLRPQQYRDWKPEVAEPARADLEGDRVTIENVRNFDYRSPTDFTVRHETRTYDLRDLRGADLFVCYWGSPYMAHPILSFDFGQAGRVCFSIETRPEKGESYSALGGLYRQFELFYVVADERDVIALRTNHREGEDVYLYHLKAPRARESFLEYVRMVNELHQSPRWYNAISNNCTTAVRQQRDASARMPWDWRMLVNGLGDELLYEQGAIDTSLPFAELKQRSRINDKARAVGPNEDFSAKIREGLPGM